MAFISCNSTHRAKILAVPRNHTLRPLENSRFTSLLWPPLNHPSPSHPL